MNSIKNKTPRPEPSIPRGLPPKSQNKDNAINKEIDTRYGKGIIKGIDNTYSCIIYSIFFTTGLFKNTTIDMSKYEVYIPINHE